MLICIFPPFYFLLHLSPDYNCFLISFSGLRPALMPFWALSHGFAAVKLIKHLLHTFPSCASIGAHLPKISVEFTALSNGHF